MMQKARRFAGPSHRLSSGLLIGRLLIRLRLARSLRLLAALLVVVARLLLVLALCVGHGNDLSVPRLIAPNGCGDPNQKLRSVYFISQRVIALTFERRTRLASRTSDH